MTNSALAPLSRRMKPASLPFIRVFNGTSTAPTLCSASAATIHSWMFGAQTATRSPPWMSSASRARAAWRRSWSRRW
ncbi:hypothetical protein D9M70_604430 [compost metagenome]